MKSASEPAVKPRSRRPGARGNLRLSEFGHVTRFTLGVSGNPGGRRATKPFTEAHRTVAALMVKDLKVNLSDSVALAAAKRTGLKAISGNVGALAEITDRVEGRALQALRIAGDDGGPVRMGIETQSLEDLRREIKKFQDLIRARALNIE